VFPPFKGLRACFPSLLDVVPVSKCPHLTATTHRLKLRGMANDSARGWQIPCLRVSLLIRTMLPTRRDAETWPPIRTELRKALALRIQIQRAGWFN